jgi:hypothetical protein
MRNRERKDNEIITHPENAATIAKRCDAYPDLSDSIWGQWAMKWSLKLAWGAWAITDEIGWPHFKIDER